MKTHKTYSFHATEEVHSRLQKINGRGNVSQWILSACRQKIERETGGCAEQPSVDAANPVAGVRFITHRQVMPLTGHTDPSAFWQFVHRNGVPFVRLGARRIVFEESALRAWIDSRSVGQKRRGA